MTDLLTRDPNDTGEIPPVGETTERLNPFLLHTEVFPIVLRRSTAVEEDFLPRPTGPNTPPGPDPLPPPPPPTPREMAAAQPIAPLERVLGPYDRPVGYVGRHWAKPRWYSPLVEAVALGWARVRRSM